MTAPQLPPRRRGPRPLPWHLMAAAYSYVSSNAALPLLRNGSIAWSGRLAAAGEELRRAVLRTEPDAFARAVDAAARERFDAFLRGVERYRRHPYRRRLPDPPVLWSEGTTRLLDYGVEGKGAVVLLVPSLINRAYILDLSPRRSFVRWLAARGLRPLLVDWGTPGGIERRFTLTDYVAARLESALGAACEAHGGAVPVLGYCMGGNLALALALRRPSDVAGLALMATPWDFHAERPDQARALGALVPMLEPALSASGELATDLIQCLFAAMDPLLVERKFVAFADLDPSSARARDFVALEDWLNDGVPLVAPVARECLAGWYGANAPARGAWRVGKAAVDPGRLEVPALAVLPSRDRIVPPGSAEALVRALPRCRVLRPEAGHIGMIAGRGVRRAIWAPLLRWLHRPD